MKTKRNWEQVDREAQYKASLEKVQSRSSEYEINKSVRQLEGLAKRDYQRSKVISMFIGPKLRTGVYSSKDDLPKVVGEDLKIDDPYEKIMKAIERLEFLVEENRQELVNIKDEIESLSKNLSNINSTQEEEIIIYFKDRDECNHAFQYLFESGVGFQPIGAGAALTTNRAKDLLGKENFKFNTAKDTEELYQKEPNLVKTYADQVKKHYRLPSWKKQTNH